MRILGLDPSLSSTGWGIIEVESNTQHDGKLKTRAEYRLLKREWSGPKKEYKEEKG